jgi:[ribosomal protein S5]-alanine N-acetyltransferase
MSAPEVALRAWRPSDRDALAALADDRRIWLNLRDVFPHPYGVDDADRFIGLALRMTPPTYFAVEAGGRLAGGIGYILRGDVERISAEVGYWLGVPFWGRGIATRAVRLVTREAFAGQGELRRLYALPFATNAASARVLEKAGYRREALLRESAVKDGVVLDQWLYAILRSEHEAGQGVSDGSDRR